MHIYILCTAKIEMKITSSMEFKEEYSDLGNHLTVTLARQWRETVGASSCLKFIMWYPIN